MVTHLDLNVEEIEFLLNTIAANSEKSKLCITHIYRELIGFNLVEDGMCNKLGMNILDLKKF